MIKLSSYHTHTEFCDGKSSAQEMILAAISRSCPEIGFSSHSPLPYKNGWAMTEVTAPEYLKTLEKLKKSYKKQIKVYIGVEQDVLSPVDFNTYDYVIGSVHHVRCGNMLLPVDESSRTARENIEKHFGGDPYLYCESYFAEVERVYEKTKCDIIGHFDLVTKYIEVDPGFDENHPRYVAARDRALDILLRTPAVFEVNTGAMGRGYRTRPYPSPTVLDRIAEVGKPIIINADSHSANTVDFMIDELGEKLSSKGHKIITSMDELLSITRKSLINCSS